MLLLPAYTHRIMSFCLGLFTVSSLFADTAELSNWNNYANSIAHCTPGEFTLPNPVLLFSDTKPDPRHPINETVLVYSIRGLKEDKCLVDQRIKVTKTVNTADPNVALFSSMYLSCAFTPDELSLLAQGAKEIASGTIHEKSLHAIMQDFMPSSLPEEKTTDAACTPMPNSATSPN